MEFLKKTAEYLLQEHAEHLSEICIVLPNRRAGVFLKKHFSSLITSPVFLPRIVSIQDFIVDLSGTVVTDEYTLLIELYKSYVTVKKEGAESFDDFLKWGNKLLQDFDEIDQHLGDARYVFTYLKEEKNLALWALDKTPLSDFQVNYLGFYGMLYDIYLEFGKRLQALQLGNYGMACRKAVANINDETFVPKFQKVIFTGLNALTRSEEVILGYFAERKLSEMLWDADNYYVANRQQEAGTFIRKHLKGLEPEKVKWIGNELATEKKEINIIGVSGNIGQVKFTASEINRLLGENTPTENISIVLNEESLLIPLLNSIPEGINAFNITMGFPLKLTPIYSLIELIFTLQLNSERFRSIKQTNEPLFYHKDLQKLFSHNYFPVLLGKKNIRDAAARLTEQKKVFYTRFEVHGLLSKMDKSLADSLAYIFEPWQQESKRAIECLLQLIDQIREQIGNDKGIEIELLFAAYKILQRLSDISKTDDISMSATTLQILFDQNISQSTVPFVGEPLKGLQIMGMLETRALDFDTIFMLSVNEGVLPKGKTVNSFIPHGIRIDAGLPTYKQNEQIFAYHFYRLLQGCKKIYLLYNTQPDDMGGGEQSRFINQLVYELPKYNPDIIIKVQNLSIPPLQQATVPIVIKKTSDIVDKLKKIGERGFSPSALNSFRKCTLQYYFNYIAEIKEADELTEIIDQQEFGNYLHAVLEKLFTSLSGEELTIEKIEALNTTYEKILTEEFGAQDSSKLERMSGKNLLIFHVIKDYLKDFLNKQKDITAENLQHYKTYRILAIEKKLSVQYQVETAQGSIPVNIIGKIDRVDQMDDHIQIIDYKSGDVRSKNFTLEKLFEDEQDPKNDYCFQLMLYLWLFGRDKEAPSCNSIHSGVWSFRKIQEGVKNVTFSPEPGSKTKDASIGPEQLAALEDYLNHLLQQLFDMNSDFVQTSNEDNCRYCPYKGICRKG
ncbi:MAG: PD-(D/E)XK nuclease family protein [Bacteroidota bacterium]